MTDAAPDLFGFQSLSQGDLFAAEPARNAGVAYPDPNIVRARLERMLAAAVACPAGSPWDDRTTRVNKILFPQMIRCLPETVATDLLSRFQAQMQRLKLQA